MLCCPPFHPAQSCITDSRNDLQAEAMLTTLLMGNRDLLEHSITPGTIAKFVELIRLQPENDRFLKLLCALCTCDGSPVPCNQEAITDVLLKDSNIRRELLVFIRVSDETGRLEVRHGPFECPGPCKQGRGSVTTRAACWTFFKTQRRWTVAVVPLDWWGL